MKLKNNPRRYKLRLLQAIIDLLMHLQSSPKIFPVGNCVKTKPIRVLKQIRKSSVLVTWRISWIATLEEKVYIIHNNKKSKKNKQRNMLIIFTSGLLSLFHLKLSIQKMNEQYNVLASFYLGLQNHSKKIWCEKMDSVNSKSCSKGERIITLCAI